MFKRILNKICKCKKAGNKFKDVNDRLNLEIADMSSRFKHGFPNNRDGMKAHLGKEITVTGVLASSPNDRLLVLRLKHENQKLTDHLWIDCGQDIPPHWFYRIVSVKGTVGKYGTISHREKVQDKYCLNDVEIFKTY